MNYKMMISNVFLLSLLTMATVDAYIIAPGAVPLGKQMKWLKQITADICTSKIGELSTVQVSQSRDLMYEWSHNPKLFYSTSNKRNSASLADIDDSSYYSPALAVESLLKRVVDEQKASGSIASSEAVMRKDDVDTDNDASPTIFTPSGNMDKKKKKDALLEVTVGDYNCVLDGWARTAAAASSFQVALMASERCEQILEGMMQYGPYPDMSSFKACLMAWRQAVNHATTTRSSSGGQTQQREIGESNPSPYRAQRLLELMIRLSSEEGKYDILPDGDCFDIVLQTWSRSGEMNAPRQTELLLSKMDQLHRTTGLIQLRPRRTSLNAVLTAWARSSHHPHSNMNAPKRAASILEYMEIRAKQGDVFVEPDSASYNIVMNAIAHSPDHVWAAKKADSFVQHVVTLYKERYTNEPRPTTRCTAMKQQQPLESKLVPDTILFNTAMGLWGKSKKITSQTKPYQKARTILDIQLDLYENYNCKSCEPDVFGFTSVIGCCATDHSGTEQEKAFDVALRTYRQLQTMSSEQPNTLSLQPNHVTYGAMLKACAKLLPAHSDRRKELVREIFQDCRTNGYVGEMVISQLREAAVDPTWYHDLMEGYCRTNMPESWCRNVPQHNDYRHGKSKRHENNNNKERRYRKRAEV